MEGGGLRQIITLKNHNNYGAEYDWNCW